jgi:ribosomal-protein-alanine N-acetyltransferase
MKISFRPITRDDLAQVIAINEASLSENYTREQVWDSLFDAYAAHTFVAVASDGAVVGYILSSNNHIASFAIDAKYRGRGVGKNLLQRCLNSYFPNTVTLHVRVANVSALQLYVLTGFVERQHIANYYTNPAEDGLLMARDEHDAQWFDPSDEMEVSPAQMARM